MIDSFRGPHRFLSNFYPAEVAYDGVKYPTVEHAYQAAKTADLSWRLKIRNCVTPGEAKAMGRKAPLRFSNWDRHKVDVMLELLRQKFRTEPLTTWLLRTNGSELVEGNNWGDSYWGVCDGEGLNVLGNLLMKVRSELSL